MSNLHLGSQLRKIAERIDDVVTILEKIRSGTKEIEARLAQAEAPETKSH